MPFAHEQGWTGFRGVQPCFGHRLTVVPVETLGGPDRALAVAGRADDVDQLVPAPGFPPDTDRHPRPVVVAGSMRTGCSISAACPPGEGREQAQRARRVPSHDAANEGTRHC